MKIDSLIKVIEESIDLFGEDELAYLSLTSKNELVIRDKIAYKLYKDLDKNIVAREFSPKGINSRIDLAILENSEVKDIIELKSMYTFDSMDMTGFINSINKDFYKNGKLVNGDVSQYEIIIATHVNDIPSLEYKDVIKYYRLIKKYMSNTEDAKALIDRMNNIIMYEFKEENYDVRYFKKNVGKAFGVEVDICFWVVQKNRLL